nr:keratinocyte proline-rich protein-like [Agelaius phoeniceus]
MHYPGERCLPGPKFLPEFLPPCQAHPEPFANTCHPLSITKGPAPRWGQSCPQAAAVSLLPCQPLVQKCLLLYPEPCETTRLLPSPRGCAVPQTPAAPRSDQKRAARSLPPCAPRCPEPGRLRFPPCGIRGSSASCRAECRPRKAAACPPRCAELSGCYSLPLRGGTECPPQQSVPRSFLREQLAGVAPHRCSKGYPTQEFGTGCYAEQQLSVTKVTEERPPLRAVAKGSPQLEGSKGRSCSAQHLSKSRCGHHHHHHHPRGTPRPSRLVPAGAKRSGHSKKSRSASKWLW